MMDKKFGQMMSKLQRHKPNYHAIQADWSQHDDGTLEVNVRLYQDGRGHYAEFNSFRDLETYIDALPERNPILFRRF